MMPTKLTSDATITETMIMTIALNILTSRPRLLALSSPNDSRFSLLLHIQMAAEPSTVTEIGM